MLQLKKEGEEKTPQSSSLTPEQGAGAAPAKTPAPVAPVAAVAPRAAARPVPVANPQSESFSMDNMDALIHEHDHEDPAPDMPQPPDVKSSLFSRIRFFPHKVARHFTLHPKQLLGIALIALVLPLGFAGARAAYHHILLNDAYRSYEMRDYTVAAGKLAAYAAYAPGDAEAEMLLARSYLHLQRFDDARNVLNAVSRGALSSAGRRARASYLGALAIARGERDYAVAQIRAILSDNPDSLAGQYLQLALYFFIDNDSAILHAAATEALAKADAAESGALAAAAADIRFLRQMLFSSTPSFMRVDPPLPFRELAESRILLSQDNNANNADNALLNLRLSSEGFYNVYFIPVNRALRADDASSVQENFILLQSLGALQADDLSGAAQHLQAARQRRGDAPSLFDGYASALLAVRQNNYAEAARHYQAIRAQGANADVNLMLAAALWAADNGGEPTPEMFRLYGETLQFQEDNVPALVNLAFFHLYQGDLEKAGELLARGSAIAPGNFHVVFNLAFLDIVAGNYDEALKNLYILRENVPESLAVALGIANVFIGKERFSDAIRVFHDLKKSSPSPEQYLAIADLYQERSQPLLVINELAEARAQFPGNTEILLRLLLEYANMRDLVNYNSVQDELPRQVRDNDYRALLAAALTRSKTASASRYFDRAAQSAETPAQKELAYRRWLRTLLEAGDSVAAQAAMQQARAAYPDALPRSLEVLRVWLRAADATAQQKRVLATQLELQLQYALPVDVREDAAFALIALEANRKAIDILEALPVTHGTDRLLRGLRVAYSNLGQTETVEKLERRLRAIAERRRQQFERAIAEATGEQAEAAPTPQAIAIARGGGDLVKRLNLAVKDNDFETAIAIYTELIGSEQKRFTPAVMYQNRGVLHLKLNQFDAAADDFARALTEGGLTDKDRLSVLYNQSIALAKTRRYQEAAASIKQLVDAQPQNTRALLLYSQVLGKLRSYKELTQVLTAIIELQPARIPTYVELAKIQRLLGDNSAALATLNQALEIAPDSRIVHHSLAELYTLLGDNVKAKEHLAISDSL